MHELASHPVDYSRTPEGLSRHVLERNGCPLHFWLGGQDGRPLVAFLHGATMDHRMFNAQIPTVAQAYRVLVWDARGHGRSVPMGTCSALTDYADDLLAVLDAAGAPQAVLIGQSLGGYIGQRVYFDHPERVLALGIIGSTPLARALSWWEMAGLKGSLPLFALWPYGSLKRVVARNTAITPGARAYALDAVSQIARRDFLTIWRVVTLAVDRQGLPGRRIEVPLLLTHGDQDNAGTIRRDAPGWASHEPDVRYVVIPEAGHNANQDNPAFFNETLMAFLRERVPGGG